MVREGQGGVGGGGGVGEVLRVYGVQVLATMVQYNAPDCRFDTIRWVALP
jgi:hypothetical protein